MADRTHRVTFVLTHPSQYMAPWFRHIAATRPEVALTVLYGTQPSPDTQAAGFGGAFEWDVPLLDGYDATVLAPERAGVSLHAGRFSPLDAPAIAAALAETRPDAVVVPGWHAAIYVRALAACRARGWPVIYRGDSTLASGPRGLKRPLWRWHTARRLRGYDAWLAVGTRAREYLAAFGTPEPLTFASPHAVDNARFGDAAARLRDPSSRASIRASFGIDAGVRVVLFAGKLIAHKRPADLIAAAARCARPVHLLFAGAGPEEEACRRAAAAAGVTASFAGFLNQSRMPDAFAAADCLVLPSAGETWGLVVNEALASGLPCIVSDRVGCAPDLVDGRLTGRVVRCGDRDALARAIDDTLETAGAGTAEACRTRAASHGFTQATDGLVAACDRLRARARADRENAAGRPRLMACCGTMVIPGGLERMTFKVLQVCRERGAAVHVVVNDWEGSRIVTLAEQVGAAWSGGGYRQPLARPRSPLQLVRLVGDAVHTSRALLDDARRFGPSHVLLPDWGAALRNAPALAVLRRRGVRIVMRVGNAPVEGRWHRRMWRWGLAPLVDLFVPNSEFLAREVAATGIDARRIAVVRNAVARAGPVASRAPDRRRIIYVGQIIPPKGVDLLLDALGVLVAGGVDATLEIVGRVEGWESPAYAGHRAALMARATRPDVAGRVAFSGHRDDVVDRLAEAAVHCCPSRPEQREGLAGVVLEAKLAGVPSVVTPTGSLPELIRHGVDGWVARAPTADALAEGLRHYLTDPQARDRAGVDARASLDAFSESRFAEAWARVFGITSGETVDAREARAS